MKKSYLVTPLVAGALILPAALPATAAQASAPAPAAVSTVNKTALTTDQIKAERSALNSRINMLQETQKAIPGSQYADQIEDLIKTALDLSGAIDTIAHGGVPAYDPATIVPRIHLAIDAADAIKTGNTTLQHKVKKAHVELGLEIAKRRSSLLIRRAPSPGSRRDQSSQSSYRQGFRLP
ncbi:cAMP factor [Cutibacterium acnes JCM 18918]|nr:cAMP factor [Cutibacterium acnes JCM 18918]